MIKSAMLAGGVAIGAIACAELPPEQAERSSSLERGRTTVTVVDLQAAGAGLGVNSVGEVVGSHGNPARAFHWRAGVLEDIHPSADPSSSLAQVISDAGQVGGALQLGATTQQAAMWNGDLAGVIAVDPVPFPLSYVRRLNSAGQAAIRHWDGTATNIRDLFWSTATGPVDIGDLGEGRTSIADLNEAGVIVGHSGVAGAGLPEHAFVWRLGGTITDLGTLGGELSVARAINDRDVIVGYATTPDGTTHAASWTDGVIQPIAGGAGGVAWDINNSGNVVGTRVIDGRNYATLWRDGAAIDLGAGPGSEALRINDLDIIVGRSPSGAFVWTNPAEGAILLPALGGTGTTAIDRNNGTFMAGNFVVGRSITEAGSRAVRWEIQVTPLSEDGPIGDLQNHVETLAGDGTLSDGEASSLDAKIEGALRQCERGNDTAARNLIEAFVNHVEVLVRTGRLDAAAGQALTDEATAILAALAC